MELNKPHHSERSGRTIAFNSMVLRRHYRQLREELAKLPVPVGLEDLERPFTANISSTIYPYDLPAVILKAVGDGTTSVATPTTTTTSTSSIAHIDESSSSSDSNIPNIQVDSNDPMIISINEII